MSTRELLDKIKKLESTWNDETRKLVDDLWSIIECAETDVAVFNMRLKKQWPTKNSNLYTESEVNHITEEYIENILSSWWSKDSKQKYKTRWSDSEEFKSKLEEAQKSCKNKDCNCHTKTFDVTKPMCHITILPSEEWKKANIIIDSSTEQN